MSKRIKHILPFALMVAFCFTSIYPALPAMAGEAQGTERNNQIIEHYLNGANKNHLMEPDKYKGKSDAESAPSISGYHFKTYNISQENVYLSKDLPYIVGYPDKTVKPLRYISRAEATAIFYRLYDGQYPDKTKALSKTTFSDLDAKAWYYQPVKTMYESGLVAGSDNKFRPNDPISRAELAGLAARFNPDRFAGTKSDKAAFSDVKDGQWYSDAVALGTANKWLSGYPDGTFRPNDLITRAEVMSVINRVMDRRVGAQTLRDLKVPNPYTDVKTSDWFYPDVLEATVDHRNKQKDWHGSAYDKLDQVTEVYVDTDGREIADRKVYTGEKAKAYKKIFGFNYAGYTKQVTFIYESNLKWGSSKDKDRPNKPDRPNPDKPNPGEGQNKVTLSFNPGDLPDTPMPEALTVGAGEDAGLPDLPNFNNKYYDFAGWKLDGSDKVLQPGDVVPIAKSMTATAQYKAKPWGTAVNQIYPTRIKFNLNLPSVPVGDINLHIHYDNGNGDSGDRDYPVASNGTNEYEVILNQLPYQSDKRFDMTVSYKDKDGKEQKSKVLHKFVNRTFIMGDNIAYNQDFLDFKTWMPNTKYTFTFVKDGSSEILHQQSFSSSKFDEYERFHFTKDGQPFVIAKNTAIFVDFEAEEDGTTYGDRLIYGADTPSKTGPSFANKYTYEPISFWVKDDHFTEPYFTIMSEKPNTEITVKVFRGGEEIFTQKATLSKVNEFEEVYWADGFKPQDGDLLCFDASSGPGVNNVIYRTDEDQSIMITVRQKTKK